MFMLICNFSFVGTRKFITFTSTLAEIHEITDTGRPYVQAFRFTIIAGPLRPQME